MECELDGLGTKSGNFKEPPLGEGQFLEWSDITSSSKILQMSEHIDEKTAPDI